MVQGKYRSEWTGDAALEDFEMSSAELEVMGQLSLVGGYTQALGTCEQEYDHTPDHVNCPGCRAANAALQAEKINLSSLHFSEARKYWSLLRAQSTSLKARTHETDANYLNALEKFFGRITLRDITPGHLRGYQIARTQNRILIRGEAMQPWTKAAGHSIINHELSLLARILRHCRLWARIKPYYFPLKTPKWSPRVVLTEDEEERFFKAAKANPECGLAYWIAAITTNTSASGIELRGLRLKHVFLRDAGEISEIYIPEDAVKNDSRPRKIPLNPIAKWAIGECYKRALQLGSCDPEHFLFPFRDRRKNVYVPEKSPSRWVFRRSWDKLRSATGFAQVKPHDFRFLCVTKMLENGVDGETVRAVAGHVSQRMVEYYAMHRRQAKYAAVMAIDGTAKRPPVSARPAKRNERSPRRVSSS